MEGPEEARRPPGTGSLLDGFRESVPLVAISLACFAAGIFSNEAGIAVGPNHYPIAGVLIILAFISAIGAVLSWFFAGSAYDAALAAYRAPKRRPAPRQEPEERFGGHPRPNVRLDASARTPIPYTPREPWDEGPAESPARPYRGRTAADPEAQFTLQELDGLREELLSRRAAEPGEATEVRPARRRAEAPPPNP